MEYRASLDNTSKVITVLCFLLLIFLICKNSFLVGITPVSVFLAIIYIVTLVGAFLYGPKSYLVKDGLLTIMRPVNKISIPLADIKEVRLLQKGEMGTVVKICGSGGVFGYYGNFRSLRIGKMKLYTTRRNNRILITTIDDDLIVISPDDVSIINELTPEVSAFS